MLENRVSEENCIAVEKNYKTKNFIMDAIRW
jgi:hypothetical protein